MIRENSKRALNSPTMTVVKLCDGSNEHLPLPSSDRPLSVKFARFCKIGEQLL